MTIHEKLDVGAGNDYNWGKNQLGDGVGVWGCGLTAQVKWQGKGQSEDEKGWTHDSNHHENGGESE